jgi:histidine triad (HIT) family protein
MDSTEQDHSTRNQCPFCQIVAGTASALVVYECDQAIAFLDHRPLLPGHCLLVPKAHYPTLTDLPAALVEPFFTAAQLLTRAIELGMNAEGSFVAINNRVSQSVPHLHVHIVPRRRKDGLFTTGFVWKRRPYPDEAAALAVQQAIREAVRRLASSSEGDE